MFFIFCIYITYKKALSEILQIRLSGKTGLISGA